jgi:carboxyl-terminal processing protease
MPAAKLPPGRARRRGVVLGWLLICVALVAGGCATAPKSRVSLEQIPAGQVERARHNLRVFGAVWDLVNRRHFDPKFQGVDWEAAAARFGPEVARAADDKTLYATINDMVGLLHDSHTHALTPEQADERRTRMRTRTGFALSRIEGRWLVTEVLPESPAEKAGVQPGWVVVAVNGVRIGERFEFRPQEGEEVRWEFVDGDDRPRVLGLTARRLSIAPRQVERELGDGFVYLRFDEFDGRDRRWLSRKLREHVEAPGVVIDLRHNPGGDTFSLGTSIGEFFERAVDCGTFISRSGARSVKNSWQWGSAHYRGRVVVLVEGTTASAAEIFAAVLQDHGRAMLVGRNTAGAVLASRFYGLPGGGELQLSRDDYVTPKGRRIEGQGVAPDVVVARTFEDVRRGRDRDLEAARAVLLAADR